MKSPLEDTIWGATYGSVQAIEEAFGRFGPEYHKAIVASGAPAGAARALMPHLRPEAQGLDLGCGSGALGLALFGEGLCTPLDGIDLSPAMLALASATGCYRQLEQGNLLLQQETATAAYDFVITMGLIGDYVPHYLALPAAVARLGPGGWIGFAVETRSTPWRPLEKLAGELGLNLVSEAELLVPEAKLCAQAYRFYVAQQSVKDG